jgi:hypothetical protein
MAKTFPGTKPRNVCSFDYAAFFGCSETLDMPRQRRDQNII